VSYQTILYDRSTLYEEVWKEPVRNIAKRYHVSDVALSKTCRKLGIPLPPQGYWLRPEAARGTRPALPPPKPGLQVRWEVRVPLREAPAPVDPELAAKLAKEAAPEAAIVVPNELVSPHKLVTLSAKALRTAKPYEGRVSCSSSDGCLSIHVAPASVDRALLIMNTLLRATEARGLKVHVKEVQRQGYSRSASTTVVAVDGEELSFLLWEKYSLRPTESPPHLSKKERESWMLFRARNERVPNGRFAFEIRHDEAYGAHKTWTDTEKRKLESFLNAFVSELYVAAASIKERRVAREKAKIQQEAAEKRARAAEDRRRAEEQRLKDFEEQLVRWRFARDARAFLDEIRAMLKHRGLRVTKGGHVEEWLAWITERAETADPLAPMRRDADEMAAKYKTRRPAFMPLASMLARARRRPRRR
jgi:hypothetical protein